MHSLSKLIPVAALAAGIALGPTLVAAKDVTLAVMPAGMDTFGTAVARGFSEEAKVLGFEPVVIDSQWSAEKMSNGIDDLIVQGVDGIAILPIDSVAATSWVDKLVDAKIPVIGAGSLIGDPAKMKQTDVYPGLAAYVNADEIATASLAGELAAKVLPKDRKAKIVIIEGAPGYAVNDYRQEGFEQGLKKAGVDYEIVADQPTDWSVEKGEAVCQNILTANPDVDIIFTTADPMAVGCANAVTQMGSKAQVMATAGGMKIGNDAIASGAMLASTCFKPETMGRLAARALYEAATKPDTPKGKFVSYDAPVVTRDTLSGCVAEW